MKELVRKNILDVTPYVAGKPIEETKRQLGLREVVKLASNENPLGAAPSAIEAIKKNLSSPQTSLFSEVKESLHKLT